MRIAEIVNSLTFGGAERLVTDLSLELHAMGHTVHVICLRGAGPLAEPLRAAGITVEALEKNDGLSLKALFQLRRMLAAKKIELVHTHNPLVHHYGVLAGKLAGVHAIVSTIHGLMNIEGVNQTKLIYDVSSLMTDRVVTVCESALEYFQRTLPMQAKRLAMIRNGIPVNLYGRSSQNGQHEGLLFGAVGRLVPVKDHQTLLRAFAQVVKEQPSYRLEILGDGPLRTALDGLVKELGLEKSVRLAGASAEVPAFLRRLDVFVMSSLSEALPLTVLEAMATGLPVVATNVGGIPDVVEGEQCGWLCSPGNPEAMAAAMLNAGCAADRAERGRRGQVAARDRYSLTRMAQEYEALFQGLVSAHAGG